MPTKLHRKTEQKRNLTLTPRKEPKKVYLDKMDEMPEEELASAFARLFKKVEESKINEGEKIQ